MGRSTAAGAGFSCRHSQRWEWSETGQRSSGLHAHTPVHIDACVFKQTNNEWELSLYKSLLNYQNNHYR